MLKRGVCLNTNSQNNIGVETIRFVAVLVATAFLNIGLYFIFFIVTPIIAGVVCGILLRNMKRSILAGYFGSLAAYFPLFFFLETDIIDIFTILTAAGIISLLGGIGGFLGFLIIRKKTTHVSTVNLPGV